MLSSHELAQAKSAVALLRASGAITISALSKSKPKTIKKGVRGRSGLSRKKLGANEYARQLYRQRHPIPGKRGTSGINWKKLGHTAGMRIWRAKLREKEECV